MCRSSRPSRRSKLRWPDPSRAGAATRRGNPPGSVANSTHLHLVERRLKGNEMRFHDPSATSMSAGIVGTDADIAKAGVFSPGITPVLPRILKAEHEQPRKVVRPPMILSCHFLTSPFIPSELDR